MPENVKQKLVRIGNMTNFDKATLVQLFLVQQSQLQDIDRKLQLLLEQVAVLNNNRFGKSSEKLDTENQICFMEVDGNIVFFNEAEAVASLNEYADEDETKPRGRKTKGKREKDIRGLPVNPVEHKMSEEELIAEFGKDGWYELEDEIYRRYSFTPMKVEIEEHHVGVYKSKKDNHFKKAEHPAYLLRNSLVSLSLLASGMEPEELLQELLSCGIGQNNEEIEVFKDDEFSYDSMIGHLRMLMKLNILNEDSTSILRNLSLLPVSGVSKSAFKSWLELDSLKHVNELIRYGIINEDTENKMIALHPLIQEVAIAV